MKRSKLACVLALTALSSAAVAAQIKYIAHRGDYPDAPEGSRQAYLNAVSRCSEIVKLDLRESKDGVIVLSHDPTFKRTMDWDVKISDVTWDEIQRHVYLFKGRPTEERAVSLEDGLKIVRGIPEFWLDFKHFTPNFAERVVATCERAGILRSQLMIATYTQTALAYMRERHPDIRRVGHIHVTPKDGKLVPSFDASLRLEPAGETEGYSTELLHAILDYIDRLELHGVNLGQNPQIMTKGLVSELKKRGVWVSIALIHDKKNAQRNVGLGMDAVVTRDRRVVKPVLDGGIEGCGLTEPVARLPDTVELKPGKYGGHLQDVTRDGDFLYWAHTRTILKTDLNGKVLASVRDPDHNAGCQVRDGKLYVAVCTRGGIIRPEDREKYKLQINVYDAGDLHLVEKRVVESASDRAGSLAILPDGSFVVGCLRPPDVRADQVRFYHLSPDFKVLSRHEIGDMPIPLGIEVVKYHRGDLWLFSYSGKTVRLDTTTFAEKGRYDGLKGELGAVFDGDGFWYAKCDKEVGSKFNKTDKPETVFSSSLVRAPVRVSALAAVPSGAEHTDAGNLLQDVLRGPARSSMTTMLNVAHRGLWKESHLPQNTVEAIKAAYDAGAAMVETDFVETKSGEVICLHDLNALASMSTFVKDPAEISAADRAAINLGEKMGLPRPYRIPLLADVLAVVPKDRMIQAEIKVYGPTYARQFDAAVCAAGLSETNVLVSSFDRVSLKDFHEKCPRYRTLWLGCGVTDRSFDVEKMIAMAKDGGFDIVCPGCADAWKAGFVRADADRIRAAGFGFRVYGVNDESLLEYAAGLGATGFTCNHFKAAYGWARHLGNVKLLPELNATRH